MYVQIWWICVMSDIRSGQSSYIKNDSSFPNSVRFSDQGLYLPCGPEQPLENIDFVIDTLYDFERRH